MKLIDAWRALEYVPAAARLLESKRRVWSRGITDVVVLGPHHVLRQIIKRHLDAWPNVCVHSTSSVEELRGLGVFVEGLGQTTQLRATLETIRRAGTERGDEKLALSAAQALDAA